MVRLWKSSPVTFSRMKIDKTQLWVERMHSHSRSSSLPPAFLLYLFSFRYLVWSIGAELERRKTRGKPGGRANKKRNRWDVNVKFSAQLCKQLSTAADLTTINQPCSDSEFGWNEELCRSHRVINIVTSKTRSDFIYEQTIDDACCVLAINSRWFFSP